MVDWSVIIPLGVQIPFVLLMAYILDRQARMGIEIFKHLLGEFTRINEQQAERHQKVTDSLLGLIDEMAARSQPDTLSAQQYKLFEDWLENNQKKVR